MNHERVADWLTAMPTYRQTFGRLIARDSGGQLAHCSIGTACARVVADLGGLTVGTMPDVTPWRTGQRLPAFRPADADQHPDRYIGVTDVYNVLEQYLDLDLLDVRVTVDDLPPFLRAAVGFYLPQVPARAGWEVWALNDNGVPFHLQRDALRITLGVDADQVTEPVRA